MIKTWWKRKEEENGTIIKYPQFTEDWLFTREETTIAGDDCGSSCDITKCKLYDIQYEEKKILFPSKPNYIMYIMLFFFILYQLKTSGM